MPKFKVEFKHLTEITYTGWVEAESEHEALQIAEDEPFDMNELSEQEEQGIECKDFEILEEN